MELTQFFQIRKKIYTISESVYPPHYKVNIRNKFINILFNFSFRNNHLGKIQEMFWYDKNDKKN